MGMEHDADESLVERTLGGDLGAFEELVSRYERQLFSFAFRFSHDASASQDIVQDTFTKVWLNLKSFNRTHAFRTWLYAICRNTSLDFLKKKKDTVFSSYETEGGVNPLVDSLEDDDSLPAALFERIDAKLAAQFLLDRLLPAYRDVILLRYMHQFTFDEISATLGRPLDTVKSQHRRALARMRSLLAYAPKRKSES